MSDIVNIRKSATRLEKQDIFPGYSGVVLTVSEDLEYSAGTDTGRVLTLECPWGTQRMAEDILERIRGFQYQPYSTEGALLDPAAELGDGISAGKIYSGIYKKDVTHGSLYTVSTAAPGGEQINYQYEYKSPQERKIERQYAETKATFQVQAAQIAAEVSAREVLGRELRASLSVQADRITQEVSARETLGTELRATLTQQAGLISAKVSKSGGDGSSFSWEHDDNKIVYRANSSEVFRIDSAGAKVTGEIRATGGKIGGFDIRSNYLSYNGQTWGGTNTTGAYLGTSGLQMGKNFRVDMQGNLYAASGTFEGAVRAGSIQYGGSYGTVSGSAISTGSISGGYGGQLSGSTLSNYNLSGGVNASLGNGDFAYGVCNGWNTATEILGTSIISKFSLYARGSFYLAHNGEIHKVQVRNLTINNVIYGVLTI